MVLGRPGSGKGTVAARLADALGLELVATSALLRRVPGDAVEAAMVDGGLVDDSVVTAVVRQAVDAAGGDVLLDGFPRTEAQCEVLSEVVGPERRVLAVEIDVPATEIVDRLRRRLVCDRCGDIGTDVDGPACPSCGTARVRRDDDADAVVQHRLAVYERDTAPVAAWFERRGDLRRVDGCGTPDEVFARVLDAVAEPAPRAR